MRVHRFGIPALILLAAVPGFTHAPRETGRSDDFDARERARLVAHFDSVLIELRQRDVSRLSGSQLAARRRHIQRLAEYRDAGVFPHNHVTSAMTPVFVDEHGTQCAMGYLIARDGRADVVDRVRSTRNLARIHDLADDSALVSWLERNGLTLDEAARVQPQYGGDWGPLTPAPAPRPTVRSEVVLGSVAYASVTTAVALANLTRPAVPRRYQAGALLGFAGLVLAMQANTGEGVSDAFAAANAGMAVASFAIAGRAASRVPKPTATRGGSAAMPRTFSAAPLVTSRATGVMARVSF